MSKNKQAQSERLSPELSNAFHRFLQCNPPKNFSRNLRNMMVELIIHQHGNQPLYANELFTSMEMFFEVLDRAEDEYEVRS